MSELFFNVKEITSWKSPEIKIAIMQAQTEECR